jgi:hypothetical protein
MTDLPSKEDSLERMRLKYQHEQNALKDRSGYNPSNTNQTKVNDGGASWKAKRIQRVYEEAKETGKSIETIAIGRFGSYENFLKLKDEVEGKKVSKEKERPRMIGPAMPANIDGISIEQMYQEEKRSKQSADREYARNISKMSRFRDNETFLDEASSHLATGNPKKRKHETKSDAKTETLKKHLESQKIENTCRFCAESDNFDKSTVICSGYKTYLALPKTSSLGDYNALIIPYAHEPSMLNADEDVWEEVRNFKKSLIRAFDSVNKSVMFVETCKDVSAKSHCSIEVFVVPNKIASDARIFFKKALQECDQEWNVHKKIIDTDAKGLRRSIPKELPYFYVDFRLDSGYAHVIEDDAEFSSNFGKNVIGSMMGYDETKMRQVSSSLEKRVDLFRRVWRDFDWTKLLE